MTSKLPFFLATPPTTNLYKLDDGRFQLISSAEVLPIMTGPNYFLAENSVAEQFQMLNVENASYRPAMIWDRKLDVEYPNYQEITVSSHFDAEMINDINLDGSRFLILGNAYVFVTPGLKEAIENSGMDLKFSEGLSGFA